MQAFESFKRQSRSKGGLRHSRLRISGVGPESTKITYCCGMRCGGRSKYARIWLFRSPERSAEAVVSLRSRQA
jgi:hypothetical protein